MEPLGVFDSGLGGLNVVFELIKSNNLDIVYLADSKNLPYGTKSDDELKRILIHNMDWFVSKNINSVLIACNTASSYIEFLRSKYPNITIFSIIELTAKQFKNDSLLIFSTEKTAERKMYDFYLKTANEYKALRELAILIEENNLQDIRQYLDEELSHYKKTEQKYLLACTHYSLVKDIFKEKLGDNVFESVEPTLDFFKDSQGNGFLEIYTSGNHKKLEEQILNIFSKNIKVFKKIGLAQ